VTPVRAIVRAAAYLPGLGSGRPGQRAADEDRFTLQATAVERLLNPAPAPVVSTIRLVGETPDVASWGFAALLGNPVELVPNPAGEAGLRAALSASLSTSRPEIVLTADLGPEVGDRSLAKSRRSPDSAVAFLVSDDPAPTERSSRPSPIERAGGAAGPAAAAWYRALPAASQALWVGDWDALVASPLPPDASAGTMSESVPPPAVSEGAYLPRPRYLEGLSSRWRLLGERCSDCGRTSFPIRGRCRGCGSVEGLTSVPLPREGGTVRALTWIGAGGQPTEFDAQVAANGPYGVAIVELVPGTHATFQVSDAVRGQIRLGEKVGTRLRRLYYQDGEWRYGRKAVPIAPAADRRPDASGESR
jgi:uncharacterized protein